MNRLSRIVISVFAVTALTGLSDVRAQSDGGGQALSGHHMPTAGSGMQPIEAPDGMAVNRHQMMSMGGEGPTMPGQDAFAALQEIVRILEADPHTDWAKVNMDALREHLIDMNEVTLHAETKVQHIDGGIQVAVTGAGRTRVAIQRMIPDQARHLDGTQGWHVTTQPVPDGAILTVMASDPKQIAIIRGLGFAGVLASGSYHQMHHLAMAKGEFMH